MTNENKPIKLGIDVGSTTVKIVAIDEDRNILFKSYRRHFTRLVETIVETLADVKKELGDVKFNICLTGSGAMGIADRTGMQFVQDVRTDKREHRSVEGSAASQPINGI